MKRLLSVMLLGAAMSGGCSTDAATSERDQDSIGPSHTCDTNQIFGSPAGTGPTECAPIHKMQLEAVIQSDPNSSQEASDLGFLGYHPMSTLSSGGMFFAETKVGYTNLFDKGSQTWGVDAYTWIGTTAVKAWHFDSKWKPFDALAPFSQTNGNEQLFQPAIVRSGAFAGILVPDASGTLVRVDLTTGKALGVIDPLVGTAFEGDAATIVNSAVGVAADGTAVYTVVAWDPMGTFGAPIRGAWLVAARPNGTLSVKPWDQVATSAANVPAPTDMCSDFFFDSPNPAQNQGPWPAPAANSPPFLSACGQDRPSINARPTFDGHGNVVLMGTQQPGTATAHSYVIKADLATLTPNWGAEIKDVAADGCGVLIGVNGPDNANPDLCRFGSALGIDPFFNALPIALEGAIMETTPIVAPDGNLFLGTYTGPYDNNDGHLVVMDGATGKVLKENPFGFEVTPAIHMTGPGPSDYQVVAIDNRLSGEFSGETLTGTSFGASHFTPLLSRTSTFTEVGDPTRLAHDLVSGQPAVASDGSSYQISAEGRIFHLSATDQLLDTLDLGVSIEPLATELTVGTDGTGQPVVFATYAGNVWVIGSTASVITTPTPKISSKLAGRPAGMLSRMR